MWPSFAFKAAIALGALVYSFQGGLQGGFLKRLGDVVSVCCVSSSHSDRLDDDRIRSLCGELAVFTQKYHWIITINDKMSVWKCKLIFPTDTLQQKILINWSKWIWQWHFSLCSYHLLSSASQILLNLKYPEVPTFIWSTLCLWITIWWIIYA